MFGRISIKTLFKHSMNRERSERKKREKIKRLGHNKIIGLLTRGPAPFLDSLVARLIN